MVYKRSTKRRYTKSKSAPSWRKYAGQALSLATTAGVKYAKKKLGLNPESKNYDTSIYGLVMSTTVAAFLSPLAGLAQGSSNNTRNGNGCRITHLSCQGLVNSGAGNTNDQEIRVIATYMPTLTTPGTTVTAGQLLQVTNDINSPYNSNLEGVKVLHDKRYKLSCSSGIAAGVSGQGFLRFKIKWNPSYDLGHVQWTDADTTGATANIVKGNIYLWIMCSDPGAAPTMNAYCRLHYVDN